MLKLPRLFHGTAFEFDRFDEAHLGRSVNNPTTGFGFFFTDSIEDAFGWAEKSARRCFAGSRDARVIEVSLSVSKLMELEYEAFHYFLQRARASTILKRRDEWIAQGYDGLTVERDGARWFAAFDHRHIEVVQVLRGPALALERQAARRCVIDAFHGTPSLFDRFEVSPHGTFGAGIYLGDESTARDYAGGEGHVLRVQVTLNNPYRCSARFDPDAPVDSPALGLLKALFSEEEEAALIQRALAPDAPYGFGREIMDRLLEMGYDGLIATYEQEGFTGVCQEVVAFHPEQVVVLERCPALEPAMFDCAASF